ncbi:MAG: hypothetical protein ACOY0S_03280 [Patescibacteria group bacterium]
MPTLYKSKNEEVTVKVEKPTAVITSKQRTVMTPLTCFAVAPRGVRFETQEAEENVILFLRQHLIVNLPWVLLSLVMILAPWVVFPFVWRFLQLPVTFPIGYLAVGTLFWYLAAFGFILTNFLRWFFNIYIVTNERIVDIDFVYLLYKEFSEARLSKIQDITYKTGGIVAALFNFGNVLIQTAGELPNFEFSAVPNPEKVVQTVGELAEKARKEGV